MANPPIGIIGEALLRSYRYSWRSQQLSRVSTIASADWRAGVVPRRHQVQRRRRRRLHEHRPSERQQGLTQRQHAEARPVGGGESKRIGATLADVVDVDTGDETHQLARHLRFLEPVNATRRANRQITDACVRKHRKRHFDLQAPTAAVWRRVLEQRAAESQGGIVK